MKGTTIVGIVLIIASTLALVYQGISYTQEEQVAELGPLEVRATDRETIPIPPVIGALGLIGGIGLVVAGARGKK